ncbi:hypothetical protein E2C01_054408 [Portunus trituberculatus]|uniref:Uncharacterized protein n=1 Tax=Portunus trituberculatus TaxID=210409 RepID=A0A5B7GSL8_PORTR|nr:hypothetical protein [Portunus trituberculatus]
MALIPLIRRNSALCRTVVPKEEGIGEGCVVGKTVVEEGRWALSIWAIAPEEKCQLRVSNRNSKREVIVIPGVVWPGCSPVKLSLAAERLNGIVWSQQKGGIDCVPVGERADLFQFTMNPMSANTLTVSRTLCDTLSMVVECFRQSSRVCCRLGWLGNFPRFRGREVLGLLGPKELGLKQTPGQRSRPHRASLTADARQTDGPTNNQAIAKVLAVGSRTADIKLGVPFALGGGFTKQPRLLPGEEPNWHTM